MPLNTTFDSNFKNPIPRLLTVADILLKGDTLEEDGGLMGGCDDDTNGCTVVRCLPPGRGVAGLISALCWWRRKREDVAVNVFDGDDHDRSSVQAMCSMNGFNGGDLLDSISREHSETGARRNEQQTSSNVGIGCCMMYLLATSRNELDKMMELRKQMEMLLQSAEKELERSDNKASKLSKAKDIVPFSSVDGTEGEDSSAFISPYVLVMSNSSTSMVFEENLKRSAPKPDESSDGMDQLEVELEAELERLQLHLDTDLNYPDQKIKVKVTDTASSQSFNTSFGEVIIDPYEEPYNEAQYGVSPYELKSRLHELVETRQSEQIQELETALKHASCKLLEKETEICWWKETAHLIMQHVPEQLLCNLNAETRDSVTNTPPLLR